MSRYRNFFRRHDEAGEVDALLDKVQAEILAKLAEITDLEAGLTEIIGPVATDTVPPPEAAAEEAGSEVTDICAALNHVAAALADAADPTLAPASELGPGSVFMTAASMRTAALAAGLSARQLNREDAARALRLIRHNLVEARTLLSARARASSPARRDISGFAGLLAQSLQQVEDLAPRIMRLFADAAQAAPYQGVPG
jgi:cell division septum initiation protein DivIVA